MNFLRQSRHIRNALASFFITNLLILIGKEDWLSLYQEPLHYLDMLVTFISVFIVFEYVDWVIIYLNRRLSFKDNFRKRLIVQVFMGIVIPGILAILLTWLMWHFLWDKHLVNDGYFKYEFLPQLLLIVVVNLIFLVAELFKVDKSTNAPKALTGQHGNKKVILPLEEIAFIQLHNAVIYAQSHQDTRVLLQQSLDSLEASLPSAIFFRANRQVIFSKGSCQSYQSIENGKIAVEVSRLESPVIVSQKRAAAFRSWIK